MKRVGVRELRQNASKLLAEVAAGETFEITERGRPVARLTPLPKLEGIDAMIAAGRIRPARGSFRDLPPPRKPKPGQPLPSEILEELRADER